MGGTLLRGESNDGQKTTNGLRVPDRRNSNVQFLSMRFHFYEFTTVENRHAIPRSDGSALRLWNSSSDVYTYNHYGKLIEEDGLNERPCSIKFNGWKDCIKWTRIRRVFSNDVSINLDEGLY